MVQTSTRTRKKPLRLSSTGCQIIKSYTNRDLEHSTCDSVEAHRIDDPATMNIADHPQARTPYEQGLNHASTPMQSIRTGDVSTPNRLEEGEQQRCQSANEMESADRSPVVSQRQAWERRLCRPGALDQPMEAIKLHCQRLTSRKAWAVYGGHPQEVSIRH
jgi:hypothetical protein